MAWKCMWQVLAFLIFLSMHETVGYRNSATSGALPCRKMLHSLQQAAALLLSLTIQFTIHLQPQVSEF